MKSIRQILSILIMAAVVVTFMPTLNGQVYAASKKPAAPKILSAVETTTVTDEFKVVVMTWAKAKNAKKYQVAIRSPEKKWVKVKTVKKTKKNKKKYTKPNQYRVVAKGKKYNVYQYTYQYTKMDTTKGRSYRFVEAPGWEDLQPDTEYIFAVRSVNGKKYSNWSTVAVTTSGASWKRTTLTTPGQSLTQSIDGQAVTLTIGQQVDLPIPNLTNKEVAVPSTLTITPTQIEYYMDRSSGPIRETVTVVGTTPEGFIGSMLIDLVNGQCTVVNSDFGNPDFNSDWSKFNVETWFGYILRKYTIKDENVKLVYTLDGTEPQLGQEDMVTDAADYPFGPVYSNGEPFTGSLQMRGTITSSADGYIWLGIQRYTPFTRCQWIRFYEGTELVKEEILMTE